MASRKAQTQRLSSGSRALLADYRQFDGPQRDVARNSWRALRERIYHPEAEAREAWVRQLPAVSGPVCEDDFDLDDRGLTDDKPSPEVVPRSRLRFLHHARSVAASVAIAASVLLTVRVVLISATRLTQRSQQQQSQEAPYQGKAGRSGGQAASGQADVSVARPRARVASLSKASVALPAEGLVEGAVEPVADSAPDLAPALDPAHLAALGAVRTRRPKAADQPKPAMVDDIAVETALVLEATQAKNRGDAVTALALLEQHGKRFPTGALAAVRQVLRAEVHCVQGHQTRARALAERFAARHPKSALLGRMNKVCAP